MARLLIAAMQSSGHRARLVRWVTEAVVTRSVEVVLCGPKSLLEHQELVGLRGQFLAQEMVMEEGMAKVLAGSSFVDLMRTQLAFRSLYARALERANRSGPVDLIILPAADEALDAWAVLGTGFGGTPWIGISMRPAFHLGNMSGVIAPSRRDDWIRQRLYRKLLRDRSLHTLFTFDPAMTDFASSAFSPEECGRLAYLPDPSLLYELQSRAAVRAELGIPEEAHLVLLYGSLTARKGVSQLIHALSAPECPPNIHVLLAGRQDETIKRLMQESEAQGLINSGRLHILGQYLDDQLEANVLSAADFMWLGYSKFYGMSGVLVLAVRHGLPCIFTREGIVGYLGRKYAIGPEIDPGNWETSLDSLRSLATDPLQYRRSLEAAKEQFAVHAIEYFQSMLWTTTMNALEA